MSQSDTSISWWPTWHRCLLVLLIILVTAAGVCAYVLPDSVVGRLCQVVAIPLLSIALGWWFCDLYQRKGYSQGLKRDVRKSIRPVLDIRRACDEIDQDLTIAENELQELGIPRLDKSKSAVIRARTRAGNALNSTNQAIQHWRDLADAEVTSEIEKFEADMKNNGERQKIKDGSKEKK